MRNILINGARGIGKSTLIGRLLSDFPDVPVFGFYTKKEQPEADGNCPVYIHDANKDVRFYGDMNLVGKCRDCHGSANPEAFERYGVEILQKIPPYSLVVMDEIGFFESSAVVFRSEIERLLSSNCLVLAAIKDKQTDFLDSLRSRDDCDVFYICKDNRDDLYNQIKPVLEARIDGLTV